MLFPPANFGNVEEDLYRSALPTEVNVPFLETLNLRTMVLLEHIAGAEDIDPMLNAFLEDNDIEVVRIGEEGYHSSTLHPSSSSKASQPMSEELVLRGLRDVVDAAKYPLLLVDLYGKHRIGVLIGCLRKLQRWNLTSVFEEYRRFASGKRRLQNEQFIELFDVDLVRVLPSQAPSFLYFSKGVSNTSDTAAARSSNAAPYAAADGSQAPSHGSGGVESAPSR